LQRATTALEQRHYATGVLELTNAFLGIKYGAKHLGQGVADVQGAYQARQNAANGVGITETTPGAPAFETAAQKLRANIETNIAASREARGAELSASQSKSGFAEFSQRADQVALRANVEANIAASRIARGADLAPIDNSPLNIPRLLKQFRLDNANSPFTHHTLEHVFQGHINKSNKATGFHFERTGDTATGTKVITGTKSTPDVNGVYRGRVDVQGIRKIAKSSFFPESYTHLDVVRAGLEAFNNRVHHNPLKPTAFRGTTSGGLTIEGFYNNGVVKTYYPIYTP
jgi:hypothetical protein